MAQLRAVAVINAVPDPGVEVTELCDDLRSLIEAAAMDVGVVESMTVELLSSTAADDGDDLIAAALDIGTATAPTAHNEEGYL